VADARDDSWTIVGATGRHDDAPVVGYSPDASATWYRTEAACEAAVAKHAARVVALGCHDAE
jgi:hypothetical protein